MSTELALMVVTAFGCELAIDAALVREVVPLESWAGSTTLDVQALVGADNLQGARRVLLVARGDREPLGLSVVGAVRLRHVASTEVLALPRLLLAHTRFISHVVLTEGQPPLLVLDPAHLGS
jgi:chemotaxis signal transduction protein